ncbi:hypothetical protein GOP47_0031074 [Adiantum capillus-veneris]|nr:hypothetical protein GOP47_0031074 [Adiantum capillus-veneris]
MSQVTGAALLQAYFVNEEGQRVLTSMPTKEMWQLARAAEQAKHILDAANLWCFFKLKTWRPDYRRSLELQKTINKAGEATLRGFDDNPVIVFGVMK